MYSAKKVKSANSTQELTEILGIPISKIDEAVAKINEDNFSDFLCLLPQNLIRLFRDRDSTLASISRLRIMAAYAITDGVL